MTTELYAQIRKPINPIDAFSAKSVLSHGELSDLCETSRTKPYQIYTPLGAPEEAVKAGAGIPQNGAHPKTGYTPRRGIGHPPLSQSSRPGGSSTEQHVMKSHFIATTPQYMLCTDKLGDFSSRERKNRALGQKYVQPNSANRVAWEIYDLDYSGAADAFDEANVVVPNFITENPENGHAHYGYALEVPISTGPRSHQAPIAFLKAVRSGMTRRLRADINFKHGLGKNPLHPHWRTTWLSSKPYSLHDMAVFLDTEEMKPLRVSRETEYGELGRNCSITSDLGKVGLRTAWRMRKGGVRYEDFLGEMRVNAFELNSALVEPLGFREVQTIAKSVARWAWSESTFEKFSEIQRHRAKIRSLRNWATLNEVPDLTSKSNAEVAEILGRSERTARRYVAKPRAEYEANSLSRQKPWKAMGVSRATYYRQKAAEVR